MSASDDNGQGSFDDDLSWILEKLTERSGATFGVIYRFFEEDEQSAILARCDRAFSPSEHACNDIGRIVRQRSATMDVASDGMLQIKSINVSDVATPSLRLLNLRFTPSSGVWVVVVVGRSESTSILLLESVARRLYPVLARYIRLWWLHRTDRRRLLVMRETMDMSNLGVAHLDSRGRVVYGNTRARLLFAAPDGVRLNGHFINASDERDSRRLQSAVHHAILSNRVLSDRTNRGYMLPLRRKDCRPLIVVAVGVSERAVDPDDAAVIIYLVDPDRDVTDTLDPACRLFGLTSTEGRLVGHLVGGASIAEAAVEMHIGLHTARTYLKHIFGKTSTNRQADLIRVMLGSASAVGTDAALM